MAFSLNAVGDVTLSEIIADYGKAKTKTDGLHNKIKEWRRWYAFDHYHGRGEKKPEEERYQDPTPTNIVDMAVGIILAHPIEWKAQGYAPSAMEQEDTSKIEKYIAGTIEMNNQREEYDIPYESVFSEVRDGVGVVHSVWDPVLADEVNMGLIPVPDLESPEGVKMVQHYHETPIRIQVIDPLKCRWISGGPHRWLMVFRTERMSVYDVEAQWGLRLKNWAHLTDREKMFQEGELIDHWRWAQVDEPIMDPQMGTPVVAANIPQTKRVWRVQRAIIFENEWVIPLDVTPYNDLPYSLGLFKPMGRDKAEEWTQSAITPTITSVETLENAINRRARQITVLSSLPVVTKAMTGRKIQIDRALGSHVALQPDEDIAFPSWPGNPPDVREHIGFLQDRLNQSGFSQIGDVSAVSGYAMSQMSDQSRIRLEQPVRHLELLWGTVARKIMDLTSIFAPEASIRVYGTMREQDFAESIMEEDLRDYLVTAHFKPEFPGEQVRKHAMATQVKGTMSDFTILERYLDVPQPDDEFDRQLYEMTIKHPLAIQFAIMKKLEEKARNGDAVAMMMLQQLATSGMPSGGGAQGSPNPEQPTGSAGSTGQGPQGGQPPGQSEGDFVDQMVNAMPFMGGGQ
jgi:hypothetical protein